MKATEQYFPVVLFFESVDKIRKFDHSNASFPMVLDIMLYNVGLPFGSVDEIPKCGHVKKRRRQYFQSQSLDLSITY